MPFVPKSILLNEITYLKQNCSEISLIPSFSVFVKSSVISPDIFGRFSIAARIPSDTVKYMGYFAPISSSKIFSYINIHKS